MQHALEYKVYCAVVMRSSHVGTLVISAISLILKFYWQWAMLISYSNGGNQLPEPTSQVWAVDSADYIIVEDEESVPAASTMNG